MTAPATPAALAAAEIDDYLLDLLKGIRRGDREVTREQSRFRIAAIISRHFPTPPSAAEMREALQQIADGHVPDQPMASALPEAVYVREHVTKLRRIAQRALAAGAAPEAGWRDISTAPKDGTLILLLIGPDDERANSLEDSAEPTRTIGFNNFDNDGEDRWQFAGWCWTHDHFTEGRGYPVGWLPAPPAEARR